MLSLRQLYSQDGRKGKDFAKHCVYGGDFSRKIVFLLCDSGFVSVDKDFRFENTSAQRFKER